MQSSKNQERNAAQVIMIPLTFLIHDSSNCMVIDRAQLGLHASLIENPSSFFKVLICIYVLKQKGDLPPGRTAVAVNSPFPFQDSEIERELNELRRKAKEY